MPRLFRILSITTTTLTLVLIAWGGLVRATGSGDGCPDWPRCFGRWIPRFEYHTLIEYVHRSLAVVAGLAAVALAITAIVALAKPRNEGIPRTAAWLAVSLAPLFAVQGALGGWVVLSGLDPAVVTIHFAVAFAVLAIIVAITTLVVVAGEPARGGYARLAAWTAAANYLLLLIGTYVRAEGAGLVFRDWPLMGGRLIPAISIDGATEMALHRGLALIVAGLVIWLAVRARTMRPRIPGLVTLSTLAVVAVIAQIVLGALNVVTELATAPRAGHVAVSALLWACVVALAVAARRTPSPRATDVAPEGSVATDPPIVSETIRAYVALTKPRIITLLLITTVPAMILAAQGMPSIWLILATLVGGAMAAGAANAINMYLDRDIDQVMRRTRQRPLPRHSIEPEHALRFGFWLGGAAFVFLALAVNLLAAVLALAALAFYVFVYTMWLKRSTDQNIVIGGAAGAVPVLVGWAAVTGTLALPAWVLFAVIFIWTPPHFWALAMKVRDDYAMAGVPMMPVVRGEDETRRQIFLYSLVLFATTLVLVPVADMGPIYLAVAIIAGGLFVFRSLQLWRTPSDERAWGLFKYSVVYLGALFGAVALDALVQSSAR
jgi:protoheme IX farnesyltransferase